MAITALLAGCSTAAPAATPVITKTVTPAPAPTVTVTETAAAQPAAPVAAGEKVIEKMSVYGHTMEQILDDKAKWAILALQLPKSLGCTPYEETNKTPGVNIDGCYTDGSDGFLLVTFPSVPKKADRFVYEYTIDVSDKLGSDKVSIVGDYGVFVYSRGVFPKLFDHINELDALARS